MHGMDFYLINLRQRSERLSQSVTQLSKIGIEASSVNVVEAQYTPSNGAAGCANSHAFALSSFLFKSDNEYCLVLEDDFEFGSPEVFVNTISNLLSSEIYFDVLLLASNVAVPIAPTKVNGLFRVINAQTTAAYIIRRSFAPILARVFFESAYKIRDHLDVLPNQVVNNFFAPDMLWKGCQLEYLFLAFIPQLIKQRPSHSDIENRLVSYGV